MTFLRGFEKVSRAGSAEEKRRKENYRHGHSGVMTAGHALAGSGLGTLLGAGAGLSITLPHNATGKEDELFHKITKEHNLNVTRDHSSGGMNAFYVHNSDKHRKSPFGSGMFDKIGPHGKVMYSKHHGPEILAHELGHAQHMGRMSATRYKLHMAGRRAGPLAGLVGAGMLASSDKDEVRKWAPAAILAGATPTLYQEARASHNAVKNLKNHLGTGAAVKGGARLGLAFGSYAMPSALGAYAAHRYLKRRKKIEDGLK